MNPSLENEFLHRSAAAEKPEPQLRLSPLEWRLWGAVDGLTSLAELARRWDLGGEALALVAGKLKTAGLLAPAEFTLAEYQAAIQTADVPAPAVEPAARKYSASLKRRAPVGTPAGSPGTGGSGSGSAAPGERGLSFQLRPLIDFIIQQAGGGTKGQLAVYRVFCQVPHELLLKSRITSLNLVGDNFEIQDLALKSRLLEATRTVLGVDYR